MTDAPTTSDPTADVAALQARLAREVALRKRLVDIARRLTTTFDRDELVGTIIASATELIGAETASVLEVVEGSGELEIAFAVGGIADRITRQRIPRGEGIGGWVVAHGETALVNRPEDDDRFYTDVDDATGFETINVLAVPLRTRDRVIGVLEVINRPEGFTAEDQEVAEALGSLAAIALENAATYAGLADAIVTARMSYRM